MRAGRSSTRGETALAGRVRSELAERDEPIAGRIVVALSGGLDSMVLLHLLRFPLRSPGLRLEAAHVDHAMRAGSARDALWVRGLCRAWEIPLHVERLDPPAASEADARSRRYAFLGRVADDDARVFTAHHADDQAETVLFRAIRGTGIRGLRGIAPRRGPFVRPLLRFRRAELQAYADAVGLRYRTDPSNLDLSITRNRLRHRVMPELERARPGAAEALARLAERARSIERTIRATVEQLESEVVIVADDHEALLAGPVLRSYDPAVRARVLRHLLRRYGSTPDRAGTQAALEFISSGPSGGEFHVAGGVRLERDFDRIRVVRGGRSDDDERAENAPLVVDDSGPGTGRAVIGGRTVEVVWGRVPEDAAFERTTLSDPVLPLTVRSWESGDRIRLGYGTKKLKKLFGERRLDRRARRRVPVVEDGAGEVVWVVGVARAVLAVEGGDESLELAVRDAGHNGDA